MRIHDRGGYLSTLDPATLHLRSLADLHIQPPIPASNKTTCNGNQDNFRRVSLWDFWSKPGVLMLRETLLDS